MHVLILTFCLLQSIINANGINIDSLIIREDLDDRGKRYLPKTKIPYEGIVYKKYSSGDVIMIRIVRDGSNIYEAFKIN